MSRIKVSEAVERVTRMLPTRNAQIVHSFYIADLRLILKALRVRTEALKEVRSWRSNMDFMPPEIRGAWMRADRALSDEISLEDA